MPFCLLSDPLAMTAHAFPGFVSHFHHWAHSAYFPKKDFYDPDKFRHYLGGVPLHHLYVDTSFNFKRFLGALGTFLSSFPS